MKKFNFLILIFSILSLLLLSQKASAVQNAYISEIDFSIDDSNFGDFSGGKGWFAKITDNSDSPGGKVYTVMPLVPAANRENYFAIYNHDSSNLTYTLGLIAKVDASTGKHTLYSRYSVYNTGTVPIDGASCTVSSYNWGPLDKPGTKGTSTPWLKYGSTSLSLGYMHSGKGPYTQKSSISLTNNSGSPTPYYWPDGYLWLDIGIGWPGLGNKLDVIGRRVVLRVVGVNFSPPTMICYADKGANSPSPSAYKPSSACPLGCPPICPPKPDCPSIEDVSLTYGSTYTSTCPVKNYASKIVYVRMNATKADTRLSWLTDVPYDPAMFCHPFPAKVYSIPAAIAGVPQPTNIENKFKFAEGTTTNCVTNPLDCTCSPNPPSGFDSKYKSVNLSHLCADVSFDSCSDASCTTKAAVSYSATSDFGRGPGKYLGIDMSDTYSTTITGTNGNPAYKAFFDLWNSDTKYNGAINNGDYYINIQVLPKGALWYQIHTGAAWWKDLELSDLIQEPSATPQFPVGDYFPGDWTTYHITDSYPFYYVIPDVQNFPPSSDGYQLYITTVWRYKATDPNPQHTGVDEPMDQVVRSFVPGLLLTLGNVKIESGYDEATSSNTLFNFTDTDLQAEIELNLSGVPGLSITDPTPVGGKNIVYVTVNKHTTYSFSIKFLYSGGSRSTDITGTLSGSAYFKISPGGYLLSDTADVSVLLENDGVNPVVSDIDAAIKPCSYGSSPLVAQGNAVTLNWHYFSPASSPQKSYEIWIDDNLVDLDNSANAKFNHLVTNGPLPGPDFNYTLDLNNDDTKDWLAYSPPSQPGLYWNRTYYWKIKVTDMNDLQSDWVYGSFKLDLQPYPYVDFSWTPIRPFIGSLVSFTSASECYNSLNSIVPCPSSGWSWTFTGANPTTSTVENPKTQFQSEGPAVVALSVTDAAGYSCSKFLTIGVVLPLPNWKEIPPF